MHYAVPFNASLERSGGYLALLSNAGAINPERAFYAGLMARLGCEANELLMIGDTWRDDIVAPWRPDHVRDGSIAKAVRPMPAGLSWFTNLVTSIPTA